MKIVVDLYPKHPRPVWLTKGCEVQCLGEGQHVFTVVNLDARTCSSMLVNHEGRLHGRESWTKLSPV